MTGCNESYEDYRDEEDDGAPSLGEIQAYAWRKAGRQKRPVTVADAMRRFKCSAADVFWRVGFINGDPASPKHPPNRSDYFYIVGTPDMPYDLLVFDFDGEYP